MIDEAITDGQNSTDDGSHTETSSMAGVCFGERLENDRNDCCSTPIHAVDRPLDLSPGVTPVRRSRRRLVDRPEFLPWEGNVRRGRRRVRYSSEEEEDVPPEMNRKRTGLRWKARRARKLKFVDDGLMVSKLNMDSAVLSARLIEGKPSKVKEDIMTQNMFRRIVRKATSRGMKVNNDKTSILCVSDALNYRASAFFRDSDGKVLESGDSMKMLGFHFDRRPTCHAHIEVLKKRMRERTWVLWHLKHAGFTQNELARVYKTVIRPVLDYCCVVYHPLLTDEMDQEVERMQSRALRIIYGYEKSYREIREMADITTHRARRIELGDKFAEKSAGNHRFHHWFPPKAAGRASARHAPEPYQEFPARTDRRMMSPLYYYRRRLNGKAGKTYGERNRIYRDT